MTAVGLGERTPFHRLSATRRAAILRRMNTSSRFLFAAALLATLAACGNKGPLVRPSDEVPPAPATTAPASPPSTDPTSTLPPQDSTPADATPTGSSQPPSDPTPPSPPGG
jgi:predicted small lipoprotein YifL